MSMTLSFISLPALSHTHKSQCILLTLSVLKFRIFYHLTPIVRCKSLLRY
uniref:Uncharacterized protein n=1 Tax=Arundo donax TaxID=35708 RepID=A0A0A9HUJ1_ARUDO